MKIYAKQVPPEYQESPLFMYEWPENVYVFGNRDYNDHAGRVADIRGALENIADIYGDMQNGESWTRNGNLHAAIWYELPRDNGAGYTRAERLQIVQLANDYCNCRSYQENDILCAALEIVTGRKYENATIRGCCQGEWQDIIYPAEYGAEWLDYFETEYFNTGAEWRINENDPDGDENYYMYTHAWNNDGIRAEIAAAVGSAPEDVILQVFDGWTKTAKYQEVI